MEFEQVSTEAPPALGPEPVDRLAALNQAALRLNSTLDRAEIFRGLVQSAVDLVDATAGAWGESLAGQMVFTEYWKKDSGWMPIDYRFDPYYGVPGWVIAHRAPYISNDAEHDAQVPPHIRERVGFHNLIDLPIINRHGELLGCFELHNKLGGRSFTPEDTAVLAGLAAFAAVALENAALLRRTEEMVRQRDEFLGMSAHELRTPLTILRLQLDSLLRARPELPSERATSKLRAVAAQVERLTDLVERLLDLSRIREGRLHLDRNRGDLAAVVRRAVESHAARCEAAGCAIAFEIQETLEARFDSRRIEQVVEHLLSNAVKFGAGSPILVHLERRDETAVLMVSDEGPGIPASMLPIIFEPLARAASPQHYGGLGLGLFLAKAIMQAHGGTLRLRSEPRLGTSFFAELPLG